MNAVKTFFLGVLTTLILGIVGVAVWVIVTDPDINTGGIVNSVPINQPAPSTDSGVVLTVIDDGSEPVIVDLIPTAVSTKQPTQTPTAVPEAVIDYAEEIIAQPTRNYDLTNDQLAACLQAQQTGRRLAPYCPPNPAEYAGQGR